MPRRKRRVRRTFKHRTIAVIYDFDGTLSPKPMQEYTVLPQIGISGKRFWDAVKRDNDKIRGEQIITYMMRMVEAAHATKSVTMRRSDLKRLGRNVRYFPGVRGYFNRINKFVRKRSNNRVKVKHYIISSGLKEVLDGISIAKQFSRIFASQYHYEQYNKPDFPKLVVTDTGKTQFVFRINKGKEDLRESVNENMDYADRPIPFSNILYIGDGSSDVPGMTVTMKNGGYAIGVFNSPSGASTCRQLWKDGRIDFFAKADYRNGSKLVKNIELIVSSMIESVFVSEAQFKQYVKVR